jgi:hypothetical protein
MRLGGLRPDVGTLSQPPRGEFARSSGLSLSCEYLRYMLRGWAPTLISRQHNCSGYLVTMRLEGRYYVASCGNACCFIQQFRRLLGTTAYNRGPTTGLERESLRIVRTNTANSSTFTLLIYGGCLFKSTVIIRITVLKEIGGCLET